MVELLREEGEVDLAIVAMLPEVGMLDERVLCRMFHQFVDQGGYDLDRDTFTVEEFIEITKNSYGRDAIKALAEEIERRKNG